MSDEINSDEQAAIDSTNVEPPLEGGDSFKEDASFLNEVRDLMTGLGWGIRWLAVSLAWGGSLFLFIVLIGRIIWGGQIANPGPHYGLIVVTGLLTIILSVVRRRI